MLIALFLTSWVVLDVPMLGIFHAHHLYMFRVHALKIKSNIIISVKYFATSLAEGVSPTFEFLEFFTDPLSVSLNPFHLILPSFMYMFDLPF